MNRRYYVVAIQYNKDKEAENRTVPKAFNTLDEAVAEFHKQMGADMNNATLGWSISIVFDNDDSIYRNEKWTRAEAEIVEPTEEVEN